MSTKKNIVIVGGGAGGASVARTLSAKLDATKYNITLINPRPFFVPLPVMPRLVVSAVDNLEEKAFPSLDNVFHNGNGTFVSGKVASIEKKTEKGGSVVLDDGQRIPFEVLVLATGSTWTGPIALPDGEAQVKEFIRNRRDEFEKAQSIVIAGGGAVGLGEPRFGCAALDFDADVSFLELTGEIRDIWPVSNRTLVPSYTY